MGLALDSNVSGPIGRGTSILRIVPPFLGLFARFLLDCEPQDTSDCRLGRGKDHRGGGHCQDAAALRGKPHADF